MAETNHITFETGDLSEVTAGTAGAGSAISATAAASMVGSWGCSCTVAGVAGARAKFYFSITIGATDLRYRFYFDPNSITMAVNDIYRLQAVETPAGYIAYLRRIS